jgi:hypothetical protein
MTLEIDDTFTTEWMTKEILAKLAEREAVLNRMAQKQEQFKDLVAEHAKCAWWRTRSRARLMKAIGKTGREFDNLSSEAWDLYWTCQQYAAICASREGANTPFH